MGKRETTLLAILLLASAVVTIAQPAGATSTPAFLSSAPSTGFIGENYTYDVQTSIPVNWTFPTEPVGCSINSYPLSQNAAVICRFTSAGSDGFSVRGVPSSGGKGAWQNWSVTVLNYPYVEGNPYMTPNAGDFYSYQATGDLPSGAGPITWRLSGAPYLSVNSATGLVTGTVTAGTYSNFLTENTTKGNYTLAWITSTGPSVSAITGTCFIGHHQVTYTVGLAGGSPAGCGNAGLFYGNEIVLSPVTFAGTDSWNFVYGGSGAGVNSEQFTYNGSSATTAKYYAYAAPGSSVSVQINGNSPSASVSTGSNGTAELTITPLTYVPCGGSACNSGGQGPTGCTGSSCVVTTSPVACSSPYNSPCVIIGGVLPFGPLSVAAVVLLVGGAIVLVASKKGGDGELVGLAVAVAGVAVILLFP